MMRAGDYKRIIKYDWPYLVTGSFDWITGIFQQTVVKDIMYP